MSINKVNLIAAPGTKILSVNCLLGLLALVGAPMLLIETILRIVNVLPQNTDNFWVGLVEMLYIGGWIALAVGMRRLRVAGDGLGSAIAFGLQMLGLILALMFAIQVMLGASMEKPDSTLFFKICDFGFPFSHLFMIIVGVMMWRTGIWRGWLSVAPFLVGVLLALLMAGLGAFVSLPQGALVFAVLTAIGLFSLGYGVYQDPANKISANF